MKENVGIVIKLNKEAEERLSKMIQKESKVYENWRKSWLRKRIKIWRKFQN